jgi:hypothetical protein
MLRLICDGGLPLKSMGASAQPAQCAARNFVLNFLFISITFSSLKPPLAVSSEIALKETLNNL